MNNSSSGQYDICSGDISDISSLSSSDTSSSPSAVDHEPHTPSITEDSALLRLITLECSSINTKSQKSNNIKTFRSAGKGSGSIQSGSWINDDFTVLSNSITSTISKSVANSENTIPKKQDIIYSPHITDIDENSNTSHETTSSTSNSASITSHQHIKQSTTTISQSVNIKSLQDDDDEMMSPAMAFYKQTILRKLQPVKVLRKYIPLHQDVYTFD